MKIEMLPEYHPENYWTLWACKQLGYDVKSVRVGYIYAD